MKNEKYEKLEFELKKISNLTKKQIQKIIFYFINEDESKINDLFKLITSIKNEMKKCKLCNYYSNQDECEFCDDKKRENKILVVEQSEDVEKFEKLEIYSGKYYVFSSLYSLKNSNEKFNEDYTKLVSLLKKDTEVILALKSSLEGILTMQYIKKLINEKYKNINIYQLSMGLPYNTSIEYVDPLTLKQSLLNKSKI